jgi:hypothetical protein
VFWAVTGASTASTATGAGDVVTTGFSNVMWEVGSAFTVEIWLVSVGTFSRGAVEGVSAFAGPASADESRIVETRAVIFVLVFINSCVVGDC